MKAPAAVSAAWGEAKEGGRENEEGDVEAGAPRLVLRELNVRIAVSSSYAPGAREDQLIARWTVGPRIISMGWKTPSTTFLPVGLSRPPSTAIP